MPPAPGTPVVPLRYGAAVALRKTPSVPDWDVHEARAGHLARPVLQPSGRRFDWEIAADWSDAVQREPAEVAAATLTEWCGQPGEPGLVSAVNELEAAAPSARLAEITLRADQNQPSG